MPDLLRAIAGGNPDEANMRSVAAGLARHGAGAGLDRPHRFAQFVAQLAHESGRFRYDREIWGPTPAQRRYEDRADLGHSPAVPGEAFKFRGRAGIQLTGRANYQHFRDWCRAHVDPDAPDFEAEPDAVNTDPWEGLAPIWYWDAGNPEGISLNRYADRGDIETVTRRINGGVNGLADRAELYTRAALVLLGHDPDAQGAVRRFQEAANFTGRDLDGIAGPKTRAALHAHLSELPPLAFSAERPGVDPEPLPDGLGAELADIRALLAEADRRLARLDAG